MQTFIVDAFTDKSFSGNPAAVCLPPSELNKDVMQKIASEMRHSETCFAVHKDNNCFEIRWFTPTNEVDLCGHGTLATAHVIFNVVKIAKSNEIKFTTKKGIELVVRSDPMCQTLAMRFPCYPPELVVDSVAYKSLRRLIVPIVDIGSVISIYWSADTKKLFFVLLNDINLKDLNIAQKEFDYWMTLADSLPYEVRGICITNQDKTNSNLIKMRYFSPWNGIGEDPVNGSSHTVLGPLWRSRSANYQNEFHSIICSKRGGDIIVTVAEDNSNVELKGSAVVILSGELHV